MRKIVRIAFLQDYTGHPENLLKLLDEVAGKGYSRIAISAMFNELGMLETLSKEAVAKGLTICVFTGYMKYQQKYLSEHPDQRMILCGENAFDQDKLSINWGCPFNESFKNRYFDFLRKLAQLPGLVEVWVNDEAYLGMSESKFGCYCSSCRNNFKKLYGKDLPSKPDWKNHLWKQFLKWRIDSWNRVHGEMKKVIDDINSEIKTVFLTSPAVKLCTTKAWATGIDLAKITEYIDGIYTNPYYTFHHDLARNFRPREVYLSEWCKFLSGIVPSGKIAGIIPQGFSHTTFSRPLGEDDGYWSSLIPPAAGINNIVPYTYTLQKISPAQKNYERCFAFDKFFEQTLPLKHTAIVHGFTSEVFHFPLYNKNESFDITCILPCAEALKNHGLPYQYCPDHRISTDELNDFPVLILPEVTCLSGCQIDKLMSYWKNGGNLVILGGGGTHDEEGENKRSSSLLKNLLNIDLLDEAIPDGKFDLLENSFSVSDICVDPDFYAKYHDGIYKPLFGLNRARKVKRVNTDNATNVIAKFHNGSPAVIIREKNTDYGRIVYFAGIPSRNYYDPIYKISPQNLAHKLFAKLVEWAVGRKSELFVENWPPDVPMNKIRPCDSRLACTFEFFPSKGNNLYIGVITSYFKEPAEFPLCLTIPGGKSLRRVTELISRQNMEWTSIDGIAKVLVKMNFNTPALVYLFELE